MTAQDLKTAKPGDRIKFKTGSYKGLIATITAIDPPGPKGQSRIEYDLGHLYPARFGATFSSRVTLLTA